jgi:NADH:ubiquinone oxidoreductase subunit 6 (subunit J)
MKSSWEFRAIRGSSVFILVLLLILLLLSLSTLLLVGENQKQSIDDEGNRYAIIGLRLYDALNFIRGCIVGPSDGGPRVVALKLTTIL